MKVGEKKTVERSEFRIRSSMEPTMAVYGRYRNGVRVGEGGGGQSLPTRARFEKTGGLDESEDRSLPQ